MDGESVRAAHARLEQRLGGACSRRPEDLARASKDFGGLIHCPPALIVRPRADEDVLLALSVAREHEVPIATRGAGHSQSGQCLSTGSIVLDMSCLAGVLHFDPDGRFVDARGGTTWRDLFDAAFERGFRPLAPTYMLDTTIAGTLSVAGVGAESWLAGAQVNNVQELDVATVDGRVITCSSEREPELFDTVRAGLGQLGVILRVRYPLRRARPLLRCRSLLYRSVEWFVEDVERVCHEAMASFVSGFLWRDGNEGTPSLMLALGEELEGNTRVPSRLDDLRGVEAGERREVASWQAGGRTEHPFFRCHDEQDRLREGQAVHPWLEFLYPSDRAVDALESTLRHSPVDLAPGTNVLIPVARAGVAAPLFTHPSGSDLLWGIGLVPSLERRDAPELIARLRPFADGARRLGGVRYLSGYLEFAHRPSGVGVAGQDWATHYGSAWSRFHRAKQRWDPQHLLNRGLIDWELERVDEAIFARG